MSARERFKRWVDWVGLTEAELAARLKCDVSYPRKLRHDRRPGLVVAHAIELATGEPREDGERWSEEPIRAEEWLADEKPEAAA